MANLDHDDIQTRVWNDKDAFRGADLRGVDLSELDLAHCDFSGSDLTASLLSRANLTGANLEGCTLVSASITRGIAPEARLSGAVLSEALLEGCHLERAVLRRVSLREANLAGATLRGANLYQADLRQSHLPGADLESATLDEVSLVGAELIRTNLQRASLRSADMRSATLRAANLTEADLSNAVLDQADLEKANLEGALLFGADLRGANLSGAILFRADIRGARYDRRTRWPAGFFPGEAGAVLTETHQTSVAFARLRPGASAPLGATWDGQGVNFALYAPNASRVELCLFTDTQSPVESERIAMPEQTDEVWHVYLPHLTPGQLYGYRVHGLYDPRRGLRFNANKLLVDPYAKALAGHFTWDDAVFGYQIGSPNGDLSFDERDSARFVPKSVVIDPSFPWDGDRPPNIPLHETIIYEVHVKGFTRLHPGLPESMRGTYSAIATPVVIDYLKSLGITAVELMPVHYHIDERFLVERGLTNYWGYNTLNFFAPDTRFTRQRGLPGIEVREFKAMVKALHAAGIEVILDVVYNHTAEGNHLGPTLSYRGIDNGSYYRLVPNDERYYMDYTGTGNTLNILSSRTLQLITDSLRYWVTEMHVDGFRFDLAAALMRGMHEADRLSAFFDVINQDPVLSRVKLIAEPWDVSPGGYRVGKFPVGWAEWNGRYRDTVRRFWKGDESQVADLAYRLSGSSDLYAHSGRRPYASVNLVTAHDGFTLKDLVSYNEKHNEANGECNRDGELNNLSWNCGTEGPTDDPEVNALRARQMRNFLATLLLSQGVPMISCGDERGRTQSGNNNTYCQDNELTWMNWSATDEAQQMIRFTQRVVQLRKQHPVLRRRRFFHGRRVHGADVRDIVWLKANGEEMTDRDWHTSYVRSIGMLLNGAAMTEWSEAGGLIYDAPLLVLMNGYWGKVAFVLPSVREQTRWRVVLDTSTDVTDQRILLAGRDYIVCGRSLAVLIAKGRS